MKRAKQQGAAMSPPHNIRAEVLEEAAKLCEAEALTEPSRTDEGDISYNMAVRHCARAIRAKAHQP
jgi:hypothetical protein